jgi:ABC-2 type transport system permease protein
MVSDIIKILKNEFVEIFKDPGSSLIMVGAIFLYSIFYTIPFANNALRNVPIGVVDNDNTSLSQKFIRDLNATEYIEVIETPKDIEDAKSEYYKNKIRAFVLIPKDFERDIKCGNPSFVSSYTDSAYLIIYKNIATAVATVAGETGAKIEVGTLMKKGTPKEVAKSLVNPVEFVQNPLYNPIGSYQNYIYPLILIMILQQTMLIGVSMLNATLRERISGFKERGENGNWKLTKLNAINPYSNNPIEIVIGKSLAYVLLYFIYALIFFLIFPTFVTYDMTYNLIPMFLILVPFLFASAFLGISLVYFCKKREISFFIMIVSSVPLIFLPGFVWPRESIPAVLNVLSKFIPFETAADGLVKINQMGASFCQVQKDFWILLGLCCLYFVAACYTMKKIKSEIE